MKSLLLFFAFVSGLNGQNNLWVGLERCKGVTGYNYDNVSFSLFRNDSLIDSYRVSVSSELISDLPNGSYYIEFETLFGKRKSENFVLDKDNPNQNFFGYTLDFCIDQLSDSICKQEHLYIDKLNDGEEICYDYSFSGCFSSRSVKFSLRKEQGKYYIYYNDKKRKLKKKNLYLLREFECELRNIISADYNSTAGDVTKITYNGLSVSFGGPYGYYTGYYYLIEKLGLKL